MISERLRIRAEVKGAADIAAGRKKPEYGKESEIEWEAADVIDALVAATPDLSCTISWLENGCDPLMAAKELRIYRERIDAALARARRK